MLHVLATALVDAPGCPRACTGPLECAGAVVGAAAAAALCDGPRGHHHPPAGRRALLARHRLAPGLDPELAARPVAPWLSVVRACVPALHLWQGMLVQSSAAGDPSGSGGAGNPGQHSKQQVWHAHPQPPAGRPAGLACRRSAPGFASDRGEHVLTLRSCARARRWHSLPASLVLGFQRLSM